MKTPRWATLLGIAALLAFAPVAPAAEVAPPASAKDAPRVASAKASPAPAAFRPSPRESAPAAFGERAYLPPERAADTIADYYASGKLRLY